MTAQKKHSKKEIMELLKSMEGLIKFDGDGAELLRALRKNPNMKL